MYVFRQKYGNTYTFAKRFKMLKRNVMLINNQIDTRYTNGQLGICINT